MDQVKTYTFDKGVIKHLGEEELSVGNKKHFFNHYIVVSKTKTGTGKVMFATWTSVDGRYLIFSQAGKLDPGNIVIELRKPIKTTKDLQKMLNFLVSKKEMRQQGKRSESFVSEAYFDEYDRTLRDKLMKVFGDFSLVLSVITSLIVVYLMVRYYVNKAKKATVRRESLASEDLLNKKLFSGQTGKEPEFVVYSEMASAIRTVINKKRNGIIIGGPPGTGKTYAIRRIIYFAGLKINRDYMYVKGSGVTVSDVYSLLYEYRNKILVLDDFDSPLRDPEMRNLLKSATDTYPIRIVNKPTSSEVSTKEEKESAAPDRFRFNGRIIIVTNIPQEEIEPALLSRMGYVKVDFPADQMMKIVHSMFRYIAPHIDMKTKEEVFEFLSEMYKKNKNFKIDFRVFMNALDVRIAFPNNWKKIVVKLLVNEVSKSKKAA